MKTMEAQSTSASAPPRFRLQCYGRHVDPYPIENYLRKVRGIVDCALSARGKGDSRRLVAFLVLEQGRILRDVQGDLDHAVSRLRAWQRPQLFDHVEHLPRNGLGHLRRDLLRTAKVDGRGLRFRRPPSKDNLRPGRSLASIRLGDPVNLIYFEGAVGWEPIVRPNKEVLLVVAHQSGRHVRSVRFHVKRGQRCYGVAQSLQKGQRVVVTGKFGRYYLYATRVDVVDPKAGEGSMGTADQVVARLLASET